MVTKRPGFVWDASILMLPGDQVLMWLAVAGVATLLTAYPAAFHAVQWLGTAYLAWLGFRMLTAKPGAAPVLNIQPRHYFRQALLITLLNPKAIVFYMAFFPLFVDPVRHQGLLTFGLMAATIADLCSGVYGKTCNASVDKAGYLFAIRVARDAGQ